MPKAKSKVARKKTSSKKITLSPEELQTLVEKKAYELYEKRGNFHGNDWEDWLEAERLVRSKKA